MAGQSINKIKYVIYARRSVEKKDKEESVVSIDSQIKELRQMAEDQDLNIVGVFSEAKSAKIPYQREKFQEMIHMIQSGKADGILCWKMDRLTRNPIDEGTIKYFLQNGIIKNIKSTDRDWYPDDNALLASVEFGVATQYSRDISKHIRRGQKASVDRGYRPSIAPLGYKNSKYREDGLQEEILPDPERFDKVRELFDFILTGEYSVMSLVRYANDVLKLGSQYNGRKKLGKTNLYRIFTNHFYYGEFEYPIDSGKWYQGTHKPMITKDEYDKIQVILGKKSKTRPSKRKLPFTGSLIRCSNCGTCITAEYKKKTQKNGNVHQYIYYHCTGRSHMACKEPSIRQEDLERQIIEFLGNIKISKEFNNFILDIVERQLKDKNRNKTREKSKIKLEIEKLENRLDNLLDLRMVGDIDSDTYRLKRDEVRKQIDRNKELLADDSDIYEENIKKIRKTLDIAQFAQESFINGDNDTKRKIISSICYNLYKKDRIIIFEAIKPFETIRELKESQKENIEMLSPVKSLINKGQDDNFELKSSLMWR
jgi:site-specific DNA recombinase